MSRIFSILSACIVVAALVVGFTGCTDSPAKDKDKMAKDKMEGDKMAKDKMEGDKMAKDKMGKDKMEK